MDKTTQLVAQVEHAIATGQPLSIRGNGTKAHLGRTPSGLTSLDLSEHTGIVSYQPVELVMTARAGTRLDEIIAHLDEHNQVLPCEPPLFGGAATIGGTLASNVSGPARPWGGSIRDLVLGTQLINGQGERLRFGGQVMKNVAGYDVSRLQAGALGTLGVITEVSFKVLPKPETTAYLGLALTAEDAVILMNQLAGTSAPISGACWYAGQLHMRLSGAEAAVTQTMAQWQRDYTMTEENGSHVWRSLREQNLLLGADPLWRFSVRSSAMLPHDANSVIDWCGSQRWLRGEYELEALSLIAQEAGGSVAKWQGGDRQAEVFSQPNAVLKHLQREVKRALDPHGIFNPGRLYGWM